MQFFFGPLYDFPSQAALIALIKYRSFVHAHLRPGCLPYRWHPLPRSVFVSPHKMAHIAPPTDPIPLCVASPATPTSKPAAPLAPSPSRTQDAIPAPVPGAAPQPQGTGHAAPLPDPTPSPEPQAAGAPPPFPLFGGKPKAQPQPTPNPAGGAQTRTVTPPRPDLRPKTKEGTPGYWSRAASKGRGPRKEVWVPFSKKERDGGYGSPYEPEDVAGTPQWVARQERSKHPERSEPHPALS